MRQFHRGPRRRGGPGVLRPLGPRSGRRRLRTVRHAGEWREVYAIRYAREDGRMYGENFVSPPALELRDALMPLDYFVWIIRGGGRTIVVNTRDEAEARRRKREREILVPIRRSLDVLG